MYRLIKIALVIFCFFTYPIISSAQVGPALGVAAGMTIGGLISGMRELVQQIEQSARALMDQGNNALAQQQLIFAGILKGTIEKTEAAYANSLDKTFTQLSAEEQSLFRNTFEVIAQTKSLVQTGGKEFQSAIYKTQGAANQLISRLPLSSAFPVFYGAQVGSSIASMDESPTDIVLLGFMLTDQHIGGKRPVVAVASQAIDSKYISVQEDRIEVQLPNDLKEKINLKGGFCKPRQSFPIGVTVFYSQKRGVWPFTWRTEREMHFNANAVAEIIKFEYRVDFDGARSDKELVAQSFENQSGSVSAGCTETANANAVFNAPEGAVELNCTASWVSTSHIKGSSQNCVPAGNTVTATGSITGKDRECAVRDVVSWASGGFLGGLVSSVIGQETLCNCPGGASGKLQISGTYKMPKTTVTQIVGKSLGIYSVREGMAANISLPIDTAVTKKLVRVEVRRKGCDQIVDNIHINLAATPILAVDQISQNGLFKATLRNDQLLISAAN